MIVVVVGVVVSVDQLRGLWPSVHRLKRTSQVDARLGYKIGFALGTDSHDDQARCPCSQVRRQTACTCIKLNLPASKGQPPSLKSLSLPHPKPH